MTLKLDTASQEHFDALRQEHYPKELNRIEAHVTLFHTLPESDEIRETLAREARLVAGFSMQVTSVRSLGRGVAYFLESSELSGLRDRLAQAFRPHLSAQDRQGFRPHVVIQNKVSPEAARKLMGELSAAFVPWEVPATGLCWWTYLGGPWEFRETFPFGPS